MTRIGCDTDLPMATERYIDRVLLSELSTQSKLPGSANQAVEYLQTLGIQTDAGGSYTPDEAMRVLQGRPVEPPVADIVHGKLARVAGQQLLGLLIKDAPELEWIRPRIVVGTLLSGESSASFRSLPDDSHAVLVSRALQENFIDIANVLVYFDLRTKPLGMSLRRRKQKKANMEAAGRVTSTLRYLILGRRMSGRTLRTPATLDRQSLYFAGQIALGAVMFVIAHELAHIVHGDSESSSQAYDAEGKTSISEVQELRADNWALALLTRLFSVDAAYPGMPPEEIALWSAFTAIFATQITERALYVRRNRTHPEAWARWAVLQEHSPKSDPRTESLRLGFQAGLAGAMKFDESFPEELWPLLWEDKMLSVDEEVNIEKIREWDRLNSCPIRQLVEEVEETVTPAGEALIGSLRRGEVAAGFGDLGIPERRLERILDPSLALEFSTLRGVLLDAPTLLTNGDSDTFSVAGVRLAAEHLEGGFNL
jgi:hypothetical protein